MCSCRSYCEDCLNILVGAGTFDSLKLLEPWICYLCQPHRRHGALVPREDWSIRVQELFANHSAMEFVSGPFPQPSESLQISSLLQFYMFKGPECHHSNMKLQQQRVEYTHRDTVNLFRVLEEMYLLKGQCTSNQKSIFLLLPCSAIDPSR